MPILLALGVSQPFASAIMCGLKKEESRGWKINHRGTVLIYASQTLCLSGFADYPNFGVHKVPRGVILGAVDIVGCEETAGGEYAWKLANPRWLPQPLPWKSEAAMFDVELPAELAEALEAQAARTG